ncbi:hypothetical protein N7532_007135 [Penicillium argentinense]|uniref:Uncharacterized protein n=1 Tax=Penicillium argentinense TaxID=1131581 RepID=A0A9W9FHC1_9EURO|nr:uncharacterized protein N7532_007135 [Penicillium argentinense]KAJ5100134.1 hypothetical protein N7532_007135 [Penicillium argentinense]
MDVYKVVLRETIVLEPKFDRITHVLLCGGVGSITAAVFQCFHNRLKKASREIARFVVVEPSEADCLL